MFFPAPSESGVRGIFNQDAGSGTREVSPSAPDHQESREPRQSDQAARNGPISNASALPETEETHRERQTTHQTPEISRSVTNPG